MAKKEPICGHNKSEKKRHGEPTKSCSLSHHIFAMVLFPSYHFCIAVLAATSSLGQAQATLSATYQATFHFRTMACYMTPRFEIGCTGGGGSGGGADSSLIVEDEVESVGDTAGSVTCILHPTKGDQYRLCTGTVKLAGKNGVEESAHFATRFRCEGSSQELLSAVAESVTATTAQCTTTNATTTTTTTPSTYYAASLAVYDQSDDAANTLVYSRLCQNGIPEQLPDDDDDLPFACAYHASGCSSSANTSLSSDPANGCTLLLQSARTSFDGVSLPDGAIRIVMQETKDGHRPNLATVLVAVTFAVGAAAALIGVLVFARFYRKVHTKPQSQPSGDLAKTMREASMDSVTEKPPLVQTRSASRCAEVDADQIQKYGFGVIRQHLNGV
jgi:hypothetical protein